MSTRTTLVACMLVIVVVAGGVTGTVGTPLAQDSGETTITDCTAITEPGAYVLGSDLVASGNDTCLNIEIANGTVSIDGAGHSVTGGIEVVAIDDRNGRLDLRDVTVDTLTYPNNDTDGPGASGVLDNVTVETLDVTNAQDFTIESSHVENSFEGLYAARVTLANSSFESGFYFGENTGVFVLENNSFGGSVYFFEELYDSRIAGNTFAGSFGLYPAGFPPTNVTIENNVFTDNNVTERDGRITVEGGTENVIRNNVVTGGESGVFIIEGGQNVVENNTIRGTDNGVHLIATGGNHLVGNTITDTDVGVRVDNAGPLVERNDILDNRVGIEIREGLPVIHENRIAGNSEFGVHNIVFENDEGFVVDARYNDWGDASGPSSAPANDSDAPFADPVTGALANGSGDAISEGETPGVSNVRFDPLLTDDGTVSPNESGTAYYQVDLVVGNHIGQFGLPDSDRFYSDQSRLVRFLHGSTDTPVERMGSPTTLSDEYASCIAVDSVEVADGTATVQFTVQDDPTCDVTVSLVSYEKPGPGWSRATAIEQRLFDVERVNVHFFATDGPEKTYTVTVDLPAGQNATET